MKKTFKIQAQGSDRPGYPGKDADIDVRRLLNGTMGRLFSPWTLFTACALGITPMALHSAAAGDEEPSKKSQEQIDKEVVELIKKYTEDLPRRTDTDMVGPGQTMEYKYLTANPAVKEWRVSQPECVQEIDGDVMVAVPGELSKKSEAYNALRQAAREMFEIYGLKVKEQASVSVAAKEGGVAVAFQADGYDPDARVGFEIRTPYEVHSAPKSEQEGEQLLEERELESLNEAVRRGEINMFVSVEDETTSEYGDPVDTLRCFIESLTDYLNWLKAEGKI